MTRLILKFGAVSFLSCLFTLYATETVGDPVGPCHSLPFNESFNISDSKQCDKYYDCVEGNLTVNFCEQGFRFSEEFQGCDLAKKVNCSGRETVRNLVFTNPNACRRDKGNFLCENKKECIGADQVCDGNFDCLDASDEFENCKSSCKGNTCAHGCLPNPAPGSSGTCFCKPGFTNSTVDMSGCVDIDECSIFGTCSQLCSNSQGSFQCSCMVGYKLESNNHTCNATEPKWKLIYATKTDLGVLSRSSSGRERNYQITHNDGRPVGVTFDAGNNLTYWTDASPYSEAIYRGTLDGKTVEVVADTGMLLPEGIAFDWITGNIYFADSNLSHIAVCRNDTDICSVLIQERIDKPREIALHPNLGIMFWTDWGIEAAIMRAGMDGSDTVPIISTNITWPNGIAIDEGNSRIYWVDAYYDRIESSTFEGEDRQIIVPGRRSKHPFGIDVFGDRIFWSDWSSHEIKSADKFTGMNSKSHVQSSKQMNGLTLFHRAKQPVLRSNPCTRARCSHICTLTPSSSFRCFCPVGMTLSANDGRTCSEPEDLPKLVVAFKSTIKTMRFNSIGRDIFDPITFPQIKSISAIVYNPINHTIIMSDSASKKIFEYSINRKKLNVLIDQHLDMVKAMDIDVVGENLYWVDGGRQTVEVMSFRTSARITLMTGVENTYDILVAPEIRSLFLAKMGKRGGKIYKMYMNGFSNSVMQRVGDKEPVALAYDREFGTILWADKVHRSIESSTVEGQSTRITNPQLGAPTDVVKFQNQIFWTDMFTQELKSVMVGDNPYIRTIRLGSFENDNSTLPANGTNFMGKITVINKDLSYIDDLRNKHECSTKNATNKGCSHLCLLSGEEFTGVCKCPDGLTLDQDGVTCVRPSTCEVDQFTCSDGMCISRSYICDGIPDCSQREDEVNCNQTTCIQGNYKCEVNGVCIPAHWVCDGEQDCADGADEQQNCTYKPCNEDFDFRCESTGRCIPKSWQCDHAYDCPGDDSDERGCNFTCPDGFFKCASSQLCIMGDWVCDKDKDCEDGSDEPLSCVHKPCPPETQFTCNNGKCIDKFQVCDGFLNCADNEDEKDCDPAGRSSRVENGNMTVSVNPESENSSSGSTVAIVLGIIIIIVLVAIIVVLVLHKKNVQPKVLVRPYVQQWNKYINEPARRMFGDGRGQQKLDCEQNVYDEVYAGGSATYCNTGVYEEVDSVVDFEPHPSDKRSQRDLAARSFADSGILGSERESLYEEAEDCGSHYVSYSQKDKLLAN